MYELYENQKNHINNLKKSLDKYNRALDTSETGTGKTYTSVYICKEYNLIPFIICPKILILNWIKVINLASIKKYYITTYELFLNLKYYDEKNIKHNFNLIKKKKELLNNDININYEYIEKNDNGDYKNTIIIYDEIHKCKNINTQNSKLLLELIKIKNIKILLLSATLLDKKEYFIHIGYVLKIYDSIDKGKIWLKNIINKYGINNVSFGIFKTIYPDYASRMKFDDYLENNNNFKNNIYSRFEKMDSQELIENEYKKINIILKTLQENKKNANILSKILYSRQQIELLKIPTFINLTKSYLENNYSIVIFVNFKQTLLNLSEKLNTDCLIYGELSENKINENINNFNNNTKRVIICIMKKAIVGISLHDTIGNYPRISLISPTWSAIELLQSFGRIYRYGIKSDSKQFILFCLNTYEENIAENIKAKIKNIAMFNDGNCLSYKIEGFTYENADCSILNNNINISKKKNILSVKSLVKSSDKLSDKSYKKENILFSNNNNYFKLKIQPIIKANDNIISNINNNINNNQNNNNNNNNIKKINQVGNDIDLIFDEIDKLHKEKVIITNSIKINNSNDLLIELEKINSNINIKLNKINELCFT
jgi:superfamily II DNA or RNA helicase